MDLREMRASCDTSRLSDMGDDVFLLAESNHRVANEIAAALAALRLVRAAKGSTSRWRLLGDAIDRLEAFAETHRHFAATPGEGTRVDIGSELVSLCSALAVARRSSSGSTMSLDLPTIFVDGGTARCVALIANELVTNAIKYGLAGRAGLLIVSLSDDGTNLNLLVSDDGQGITPDAAADREGLGSGIVAELVRRSGGELTLITGSTGTSYRVSIPHDGGLDG